MTKKQLEELLIDRALGGLDEHCAELLDAYTREKPAVSYQSSELAEMVSLARQAMNTNRARIGTLPPFPGARIRRELRGRRVARHAGAAAALAACLSLGILIGRSGGPPSEQPPVPNAHAVTRPTVHTPAEPQAAPLSGLARQMIEQRLAQAQSPPQPRRRIQWSDLVRGASRINAEEGDPL